MFLGFYFSFFLLIVQIFFRKCWFQEEQNIANCIGRNSESALENPMTYAINHQFLCLGVELVPMVCCDETVWILCCQATFSPFRLVSFFVEQGQWLPLRDFVGIQWWNVCEAAWAMLGEPSLRSGRTTVSFCLYKEKPLRQWLPRGQSGIFFLQGGSLEP